MIDRGCWDEAARVNIDAIDLLVSMNQYHYKSFGKLDSTEQREEFAKHMNSIIESLMTKIGQDNIQLKNHSYEALLKISNYPLTDYAVQIDKVMVDSGTSDQRHLTAKLTLLQDLIVQHKVNDQMYDAGKIADFSIKQLDRDEADVKALGYIVLLRQHE
jgi:hypothetical protein